MLLSLLILASAADACPMCFAGVPNKNMYLATTAVMMLLPTGILLGVGLWIRSLIRKGAEDTTRPL